MSRLISVEFAVVKEAVAIITRRWREETVGVGVEIAKVDLRTVHDISEQSTRSSLDRIVKAISE